MSSTTRRLSGWGNYPVEECAVARPESFRALHTSVTHGYRPHIIPRGLGRSYGDAALNKDGGVILVSRLNRFLSFDERTGVLECEAGASFAEILEHFLPRGWLLPTTPGTKYVTVGGAIAADVHGKNHHVDRSFGNFVVDLKLLTASGAVVTCSPSENVDVFQATVGGMGLTGCIVSARVLLSRVESAFVDVTYRRAPNLDAALDHFSTSDHGYRYSVAWIDCLASGRSLGRSVVMLGNDAPASRLPGPLRERPLALPPKRPWTVPCHFPAFALGPLSVRLFNAAYYARHRDGRRVVDYGSFFYPLDNVLHWNRFYGRRGFVQYQALFPPETSRRGLIELLKRIAASRQASFLAVLKSSGPADGGMLSFMHPGHTLALDFPNTGEDLRRLLRSLDETLLKHGGRLYLAKDSMTTAEAFRAMYPRLREFQQVKSRIDPRNRFVSSQARRLGIV
jgi:FAD/FMN-containing dehydrogenase